MKKVTLLFLLSIFLMSCGPKRMSCYGKRCVDVTTKSQPIGKAKV